MTKDSAQYSILIESRDRIHSLLHVCSTENLNIIFPLFLNEGKCYAFILKDKKFSDELQNCVEGMGSGNGTIYFLQINVDYILTLQPLLLQLVRMQSLVECTDEEGLFFEEILKKLDQYYQIPQSSLISRFYLSIFLQCFSEIIIRERTFRFREEVLARDFLKILQRESIPNHQVQYYAEKLFVSRRYLTKAVHNIFGQTPKSFIDRRIIFEAKKLLSTRITMYEISEQLKFESSASFAVFFKKHVKCTPTEYRQKFLNT